MAIFIQLPTDLLDDERFAKLSFDARWAYIHCCLVAKEQFETDGLITERQIFRADPEAGLDRYQSSLAELGNAGLIEVVPGGYQVTGWLDWNLSNADIEQERERRRKAGHKGGIRSGEARRSKTEAPAPKQTKQNEAIVQSTEPIANSHSTQPTAHSSELTAHSSQVRRSTTARLSGEPPPHSVNVTISHGLHVTAENHDAIMDHPDYLTGHFKLWPLVDENEWVLMDRRMIANRKCTPIGAKADKRELALLSEDEYEDELFRLGWGWEQSKERWVLPDQITTKSREGT